ncbi:DoxX family protein [Winogradskyella undariae]|uniref:DoxX family protein n=1 Tax=Winogradskyella undariae TaxID=1285465 RepID=UPI00156AD43C|nr:DoxX family protein [Winogradskyella undariae]NRR93183.1 DoxX family protein [Winogradskyella undariae]
MTLFNKISNLVASGLMFFFGISKLVGVEKSVQGFEEFRTLLPLNPTVFRIVTGTVELIIALLILAYAIRNINNLGKLAYFLLLSFMIDSLIMEFFARPKPEVPLVIIALVLFGFSIYKLKLLLKK